MTSRSCSKRSYSKRRKKKSLYRETEAKLDRIISEYVRLKYSDNSGICKCITCGSLHFWKQIHCGHYIGRAHKATRFDERNLRPQCCRCNSFRGGEPLKYRYALIQQIGEEEVKALEEKARLGGSLDIWQMEKYTAHYKIKIKELKKEKGL